MNRMESKKSTAVSFKDIIWDLLSQWKAVLIAALLMALLTAGAKYYKDFSAYDTAQEQDQIEQSDNWSPEEQIASILEALPEGERGDVEYMVKQQEWLDEQKDYINNSLYAKANPVSQRTVLMDYYIDSQESSGSVIATLAYAFSSYANTQKLVEGVRDVIDPEADLQYVSELIYVPIGDLDYDDGDFVLEVMIVVMEDTDAEAIKDVVTDSYTEYSKELNKTVCPHTISLIRYDVLHLFNPSAVNNRNSITSNIYNIQNNIILNMEATLSEEQKAAFHSIVAIKEAAARTEDATDQAVNEEKAAESSKPAKPGISKKYALLGFILGAMIYAFIYLLILILSGQITSSDQAEYYTNNRLLGDIYYPEERKGFQKLFSSKLVDNIRYKGKLDIEKQLDKAVSSIKAVSNHAEADKVTLICLPGLLGGAENLIERIVTELKEKSINSEIIHIDDTIDENQFNTIKNAVVLCGSDSKAASLIRLTNLCKEFEVKQMGNVYIKAI